MASTLWICRTLEQLRRSRTKVTSATGVSTLPDNVAGGPIVITDSLANDEAQAGYAVSTFVVSSPNWLTTRTAIFWPFFTGKGRLVWP